MFLRYVSNSFPVSLLAKTSKPKRKGKLNVRDFRVNSVSDVCVAASVLTLTHVLLQHFLVNLKRFYLKIYNILRATIVC